MGLVKLLQQHSVGLVNETAQAESRLAARQPSLDRPSVTSNIAGVHHDQLISAAAESGGDYNAHQRTIGFSARS